GSRLAFVDADTIVAPTYLEGVKEALSKGIAATGPIRALEKESLTLRAFYRWWSLQSRISVNIGMPIFPGFNFAVTKKVFEESNGFRPEPVTNEDIEFSLRLSKYGRVLFNKKMLVYTSTRRIKEMGILNYVVNAINFVVLNKSRSWSEHRKDYMQQ
ncbi:MAG: glycosyltransferase family 2 protein, partial [Candidatus Diapherotrites archaeon]